MSAWHAGDSKTRNPDCRGNWWTIQVRQDVFVDGKLQRSNKRVRLAPGKLAKSQNLARSLVKDGRCRREGCAGPDEILSSDDSALHLSTVLSGESAARGQQAECSRYEHQLKQELQPAAKERNERRAND